MKVSLENAQALVPGSAFGKYGERYLRFVYTQKLELLKKGISR